MKPIREARLYGIVDLGYVATAQAPAALREMLRGGVDLVQLRAKGQPEAVIRSLAATLKPLAAEAGVPLVLNDHPRWAGEEGLDGVHVGQDDLPVAQARTLAETAGPGRIVGKSTHSVAQAVAALEERPDYIGFGPLFATPTKPDYVPIGLDDLREVHERVALPIFCIGGVKLENLEPILEAGARRVVIVSGILQAGDIAAYCRSVKQRLERFSIP
ncbi:MAG TPA: thiamine phosphate synthase [Chthoniobacteraceae bacterium]|nr:thiamine phosphate synthase [Chthoniobacteraceae bacterium]